MARFIVTAYLCIVFLIWSLGFPSVRSANHGWCGRGGYHCPQQCSYSLSHQNEQAEQKDGRCKPVENENSKKGKQS